MYSMGNMINKKSSFFLFNLRACFVHSPSGCWGHSSRERSQADLYPSGAFSPPERINTETHPGPQVRSSAQKGSTVGEMGLGAGARALRGFQEEITKGGVRVEPWIFSGLEKSLGHIFHFFQYPLSHKELSFRGRFS